MTSAEGRYVIKGALGSPYSIKIRAIFRYRRIPHIWVHGAAAQEDVATKVRVPVIPIIEYPDGSFHNDSTPIIYSLEARHPATRSLLPANPALAFIAHLIEDFADEWLTKAMFGYRWLKEIDQQQMSHWLGFDAFKGGGRNTIARFAAQMRARQVARMSIVGCTQDNFALIQATTREVLIALERHVIDRHFFFGTRPSLAEFGIFGQFSQLGVDPTAQAMLRADFPWTLRWLLHIDDMSGIEGHWDADKAHISPTVIALLKVIGEVYLPFLIANATAFAARAETFEIEAKGLSYRQGVFKYQLKCLADLRGRYAALTDEARACIDSLLLESKCFAPLQTA